MPAGQLTLDQVTDEEVEKVVASFLAQGATVEKRQNANGTWRVIATFPGSERRR